MSNSFNKSYRIRTEIGKDTQLHINLNRDYDVLELMSLKIDQKNFYKFHTSNYGVIAGRVLANDAFGIPNAKVSVFIPIDANDQMDIVKSVLYPYNNTQSQNENGVRYNILPNEQLNDCHTIIGTFPEKQYLLDNDNILEVFEKYYKFTTRTNNAGDYMIFGVPTGSQTLHVDIDLSDIGILSQKPRDMFYKGYNIEAFENPNKFKYDTNLDSLVQVVSQDNVTNVIPFWGEDEDTSVGITRCDIHVQYKFEPTCVFMGSVVSDTTSNGISKKCIPTPGMGSMEEITTGSGTIEMIRKTPNGNVEEFQIKGNQLINGNGVWCYQIPMNLDYMMTDEFGNMVPTNHPDKGIPTRTRVRFRVSLQDFDNDNENLVRGKILIPHNPDIYKGIQDSEAEIDYNFGTRTQENSYRDLFWNGVYSVKSYIPRIQKGANWRNEKFTGFKRVNYYGQNNPIPYNNIRIRIPFVFTIMCVLIKSMIRMAAFLNWIFRICSASFVSVNDEEKDENNTKNRSGAFISISGELCNDNLDYLCIIPGVDILSISNSNRNRRKTLLAGSILKHAEGLGADLKSLSSWADESANYQDPQSIDSTNREDIDTKNEELNNNPNLAEIVDTDNKEDVNKKVRITIRGIRVTDKLDYFLQCIEMKLAQEFKVIQFDFYNDWINGLVYIPRWMRVITKKHNYLWGLIKFGGKVKACNENVRRNINLVQQCGLSYSNKNTENMQITNPIGCKKEKTNEKLYCHKSHKVRKKYRIFKDSGLVHSFKNMNDQYIYYFKPIDNNSDKCVRLFATDIILLGTLNNCDRLGIPGDLTQLVSSTYQMPPNLALTDSDLEGNEYETELDNNKVITMDINIQRGKATHVNIANCYMGINPMTEDANYTEISGIDWGYEGPLQSIANPKSKLYKPGGHFLGITCRNAETTIKSCVNLSRICEYGVWMSQRQELNIPNPLVTNANNAFLNYATVPSGFISKDEISNTNYRRIFASLNQNKLRTTINPATGYPVYDFIYVNPTNFGGELNNKFMSSSSPDVEYMNRRVGTLKEEHYYEYIDDDYYQRETIQKTSITDEEQIMRTGEFSDSEYLKYRFGFSDDDFNENGIVKTDSRINRFIFLDNSSGDLSFPLYENSFYFYFGLKNGNTALDEFKKTYYANCEKTNLSLDANTTISLIGLKSTYDGLGESGSGTISYSKISASQTYFDNGGFNVELRDIEGNKLYGFSQKKPSELTFYNCKAGNYILVVSDVNGTVEKSFNISVGRISFKMTLNSVAFKEDVSKWDNQKRFITYDNRRDLGGYLFIPNNTIEYHRGPNDVVNLNIFNDKFISYYIVKWGSGNNSGSFMGEGNVVSYPTENNTIEITLTTDKNGNYMIPVPLHATDYVIEIYGNIDDVENKPTENNSSKNVLFVKSSSVYVGNGSKFDFFYNGISFQNELSPYLENDDISTETSTEGWWSQISDENTGRLVWDTESSNATRWNIKSALYISNLEGNIPHAITLTPQGGNAPYTTTLRGEENDMKTVFEEDNLSKLQTIAAPTINYNSNGLRRNNFSYRVTDSIKQKLPENKPFIIPVIYKPFFTEMALCYYEEVKDKLYLCGNIYNGKTWTEAEGFNDVTFNGQKLPTITTSTPDTVLTLNEIDVYGKTHTGGGLSYTGKLQKYNGRKVTINRAISSFDMFGISVDGGLNTCELTIGSSHTENTISYTDKTSVVNDSVVFFNFVLKTNVVNNTFAFKMEVNTNNNSSDYKIYSIIDDVATTESDGKITINKGCYPYPFDKKMGKPTIENTLLFRHIMEGKIESVFDGSGSTRATQEITINNPTLGNRNVYYIAIPNYSKSTSNNKTTNINSILKPVSISKLVNVKTLQHFYPLELVADSDLCVDKLNADGTYSTTITLNGKDDNSINNIVGKRFKLRFLDDNKSVKHEIVVTPTNNNIVLNLSSDDRLKIGITNNKETSNGNIIDLTMDYEATIIETNEVSPSYYNPISIPLKFIK